MECTLGGNFNFSQGKSNSVGPLLTLIKEKLPRCYTSVKTISHEMVTSRVGTFSRKDRTSNLPDTFFCQKENIIHVFTFLLPDVNDFLLYALRTSIHRVTVGATQTDITLLGQGLRNAIAVDYDQMNHILFWADITQDKIQRVKLDGSKYLSPYLQIYFFCCRSSLSSVLIIPLFKMFDCP